MRYLLCLMICMAGALQADAPSLWQSDYAAALSQSQKENKELLLFFSGCDWSGPSMKMKREILDSPECLESLASSFILLEIDFPMHSQLSETLSEQNQKLKERFAITHIPCLLLLDPTEEEIARLEYLPEKQEQISLHLLDLVAKDKKLRSAEALLQNEVTLSGSRLTGLYEIALEMGQEKRAALFMKAGLESSHKPFFILHSYQQLLKEGQMATEQARHLRALLAEAQDENTLYSLALMEFQEISRGATRERVVQVVAPLKEYLRKFGNRESEHVWRTEMMIAQVYASFDHYPLAHEYAKKAYEKAPQDVKVEIAASLRYIQEKALEEAKNPSSIARK